MSDYSAPMVTCAKEGCDESFRDHRWGRIKAHDAGWFTQRGNEVQDTEDKHWCPQHVPSWVMEYRAKKVARR